MTARSGKGEAGMVRQVQKFETKDGETFDTEAEAAAHEMRCELGDLIALHLDDDFHHPPLDMFPVPY